MLLRNRRQHRLAGGDRSLEGTGQPLPHRFELAEFAEHDDVARRDLIQQCRARGFDARRIEMAGRVGRRGLEIDRKGIAGNDVAQNAGASGAIGKTVRFRDHADDLEARCAPAIGQRGEQGLRGGAVGVGDGGDFSCGTAHRDFSRQSAGEGHL